MANQLSAYELAEQLENMEPYATGDDLTLSNSAAMLRQQANELDKVVPQLVKANGLIENLRLRIAELEETIIACYTIQKMQAKEVYKGNDRIAELEKDLKKYDQLAWDDLNKSKTIWCACGDGITPDSGAKCGICASTTPQTKPLSDEEMKELINNFPIIFSPQDLLTFARAIEERHKRNE